MKKTKQLTQKFHLQTETVRLLRDQQIERAVGGLRGSTVPRSWCESCETQCGSN